MLNYFGTLCPIFQGKPYWFLEQKCSYIQIQKLYLEIQAWTQLLCELGQCNNPASDVLNVAKLLIDKHFQFVYLGDEHIHFLKTSKVIILFMYLNYFKFNSVWV